MPAESGGSVTRVFERLRTGDSSAAEQLWKRFFPRLLALARRSLDGRALAVADEHDAAQSAFASFWQRAEGGEFTGQMHRNRLWKLLSVITVRKARKMLRREGAQKRGGGRVRNEADLAAAGDLRLAEMLAQVPAHDFDLHCEELLEMLDGELQAFALLRLMGYKNREIASICACTQRKVERKLQLVRSIWQDEIQ